MAETYLWTSFSFCTERGAGRDGVGARVYSAAGSPGQPWGGWWPMGQ